MQKSLPVLFVAFLAVGLSSAAAGFFLGRPNSSAARASGSAASAPDDGRITALEARTEELARLLGQSALEPTRAPIRSDAELEAAIARFLEKQRDPATSDAPAAAPDRAQPKLAARSLAEIMAELTDPDLTEDQRQKLWKELADAGRLDELLAAFESAAENDPNDADKRFQLGSAYIQKLYTVGDMEKGTWAIKADKAFDAALAIDGQHWEARFSKAVSLSFWPPLFGKQKEAVKQFELLVAQQSSMPVEGHHAQTHLWLGNMYLQSGDKEKASAAWRAGLALFPDNEALKKQLEQ
jgi:tetratricopeptide (TPR) repeat protein